MSVRCALLDADTIRCVFPTPSFEHEWLSYGLTSPLQLIERMKNIDIAITNKVVFSRETLDLLPHLRLIALCATGYNHIDIEACRERGIAVTNVRGYAVHTVPEHVFMLMLALVRRLPQYYRDVHLDNAWPRSPIYCLFDHPIGELAGQTLGIIGKGNLGEKVADIAKAFGMNVLFAEHKECEMAHTRAGYTPFDEVLERADIISLHCPLNASTRHLINEQTLRKMRSSALLINTGRGDLVDEQALTQALKEGWIAGAGLDVLSQEPPLSTHPLLSLRDHPRLIITAHNAWASIPAMQTVANQVVESIEAFYRNETVRRVV
jgi:glycerate dehydrogenase